MQRLGVKTVFKITGIFIISRVILLVIALTASAELQPSLDKLHSLPLSQNRVLNLAVSWDSGWYLNIAEQGYIDKTGPKVQSNYGFFPAYPILLKGVGLLVGNNILGGVIVSNILLLIASMFLYLLCIRTGQNKKAAMLSVIALYFFPCSYLFSGVFSESAFLSFAIMSAYFFECENYLLSGLMGFLLAATRPFGVFILMVFGIRYLQKHGFRFKASLIELALIPLGMLSFFIFCYVTTGDFLKYVHAKHVGWYTSLQWPTRIVSDSLLYQKDHYILFSTYYALFALVLIIALARFSKLYLVIWSLLLVILPLTTGANSSLVCMPRYILVCFPLMMMFGAFAERNKMGYVVIGASALVNFVLCGYYALGFSFAT